MLPSLLCSCFVQNHHACAQNWATPTLHNKTHFLYSPGASPFHRQFLLTGARVWPLFRCYTSFCNLAIFDPWASQTAAPVSKSGWSTKLQKKTSVYDTFAQKNWTVSRGIATFVHLHAHFGHDSFWIAFVVEIVIAFVMPTFAQINFTIGSTT